MNKAKMLLPAAILMAAMSLAVAACTPAGIQSLQGTLKNIDSISGSITVQLKDGTIQTFNLNNVKVDTVRGALGQASLEIGDQLVVRANQGGLVEGVSVERAEVSGIIKNLGSEEITITSKRGDIVLAVTPNTTIRIEDRGTANLSSLKQGQNVEVKYNVYTKNAIRISVENENVAGEVEGTIQAVNTTNNTVTITSIRSGNITLTVTANTSIRIEDKGTVALVELKVGQTIDARYDTANMTAIKITAENPGETTQHSQMLAARD